MLIMVTGVSGSGKSEYAEQISCQLAKDNKKYYVATMYPYGEDGRSRVKKHKLQRDGKGFETIEQYQNIGGALKGCKRDTKPVVLVECMSNLLANECFEENGHPDNIFAECMQLYSECSHLVIVTNEAILSKQLDIGRSSLREAMKLLASRNIVTIKQGSGTYVASSPGIVDDPFGFTFISDKKKLVQDLLEIRFLLEPSIAAMSATYADKNDISKINRLCNEVEELMEQKKDHTQKDIEFHTAIAMGSKNLVIPRLIPIINSSIPLFVETTGNILKTETIETHREIAEAIAEHNAVRAQDAMYMHLMYNKRCINSSK